MYLNYIFNNLLYNININLINLAIKFYDIVFYIYIYI